MFHYEGSRTDKHVREHEVYAIGYPGEFTATQQRMALGAKPKAAIRLDRLLPQAQYYSRIAVQRLDAWTRIALTAFRHASAQQRALYLAVLTVPLALLIVLVANIADSPDVPAPQVAETPMDTAAPAKSPELSAMEAPRKPQAKQESIRKKSARIRTLEETTAIDSGAPARVSLAVTPWGEIYLDGRMQGVSPPLTELEVAPGTHEIEIRNTTFPPYRQTFKVNAGGVIKIKHKFK